MIITFSPILSNVCIIAQDCEKYFHIEMRTDFKNFNFVQKIFEYDNSLLEKKIYSTNVT